jgi:glutathione synthase/RimK-type ligase-like ATP-grasp enzyme
MSILLVVENPKHWPHDLRGAQVVPARDYLVDPAWAEPRRHKVFNLCRTYSYQTLGYYVSLLAEARGHRPLPSAETLRDLRLPPLVRVVGAELDELIQRSLGRLKSDRFTLSIYFGRNMARRYDRLSRELFDQYPAPFLRATFQRSRRWSLQTIVPIATRDIPATHRDFMVEAAEAWFERPARRRRARGQARYDIAILHDPEEEDSPSDARALRRFERAAEACGLEPRLIGRTDAGRIAEFDALFIRQTTSVEHYTYRFARRAAAAGLVVVDDPESILRCSNKVFQAEVFARHGIRTPRSMVVHEGNRGQVEEVLGLPCVLKRPDAAFSRGVVKVEDPESLQACLHEFLGESDLVLAQEFVPTDFDWRVGVLAGEPLFACRYHMVRGHWQIAGTDRRGHRRYGRVDAVALEDVPRGILSLAVRASRPMGEGLYGVDLKQHARRVSVIEVNDNPNVDSGVEDRVLGQELYLRVMRWFRERLDARGAGGGTR